MDVEGGAPRALSPEGYRCNIRGVSPDGKSVVAFGPDRKRYLYPLEGGEPTLIPGLSSDDGPTAWSADGRFLYVYRLSGFPLRVYKLEIVTGKKEIWKELSPADPAGMEMSAVLPTPDGRAYVCEYKRTLSDLYAVHGIQ